MTSALWTAYEAAAATGGALCARGGRADEWPAEEWAASGVSIDTRTLKRGEIFVALSDIRDGHEFVKAAFEGGAAAALVVRAPGDAPDRAPLLVVPDTLGALRDLARAARNRNFGKRIGVTGSVGKTSVKEMLRTVLSSAGKVHAADKSFNNHWGVPLTLSRLPIDADFGVFEIGMNHAGEITPLTQLVRPHVSIITTVGTAHLEFLGTVENIARAKAEIFLGLEPGGVAVLPADNEHFPLLKQLAADAGVARILTFGENDGADYRLVSYAPGDEGGRIEAEVGGARIAYALAASGRHQALNSLAVLAAAEAAGAPREAAVAAFASCGAAEGRGARRRIPLKSGGYATLIDESYNANPTSMAAALSVLGTVRATRRIAVLGDMLELGPDSEMLHAGLAGDLVAAQVDRLYVAGRHMRALWDAAPEVMRANAADAAADLVDRVVSDLQDGDAVMVKGSNGSRISAVARALEALAAHAAAGTRRNGTNGLE